MTTPVFFDLDGTLTDSSAGIIGSLEHAFRCAGLPVPEQDLAWLIGPPIHESLATLVDAEGRARVFAHYRERYDDVGWRQNEPYAGVGDMLAELTALGHPLYVATAKPHVFAERILEHAGLARHFVRVFGSELDGTRTRKDELLRWARREAAVMGPAVMVGDRRYDIEGARGNGMRSVGVTWGFGTREELEGAGADAIVDRPEQIATVLRRVASKDGL